MVMVPIPAAAADAVVVVRRMRKAEPDIGTDWAYMRPCADALAASRCTRANGPNIGAGPSLLRRRCPSN